MCLHGWVGSAKVVCLRVWVGGVGEWCACVCGRGAKVVCLRVWVAGCVLGFVGMCVCLVCGWVAAERVNACMCLLLEGGKGFRRAVGGGANSNAA